MKEELRKKEAIHEEMKAAEEMKQRKKEEEAKAQRLLASKAAKPVPDKTTLLGITVSRLMLTIFVAPLHSIVINSLQLF